MHSCNSCNSSFILSGHIPPDMNMSRLIIVLAILMLSIHLAASEFYPPILNSIDASADIDTSFQLISSYDKDTEEVFVQFNLSNESVVALELYNTQDKLVKVWQPEIAQAGRYSSKLLMSDVAKGKYRMLVFINEEVYQQAVFKL